MSDVRDDIERAVARHVWKTQSPNRKEYRLPPEKKVAAKVRAARAGRPYPNLIDNMWAARKK